MNFDRRLQRLELFATEIKTAQEVDKRMCQHMEWSELLALVNAATNADDDDLVEQITGYIKEAAATPVRDYFAGKDDELVLDAEGKQVYERHFFVSWLWGLQAGSWSLPDRLPRQFLEGFCRQHGMVLRRCEHCLCGLGNAIKYDTCPICGSDNVSHKYLGGPPWDADFIYRSYEQVIKDKKRGGKVKADM